MFKYTSHTHVHIIKEKRLYMQVKCSHGKCLGKRQAKGTKKVLWVSRALVPMQPSPATLRTARTSAFLPRWLPSHPAHHLPHWHRPDRDLRWKDSSKPTKYAQRGGESAPAFPRVRAGDLVARDPGTAASLQGHSPRPAAAGEPPQVHLASLHENKTPACSGSARHIIARKL